ncbi:MAG: helix-turn-helix domain-containing protein [Betaproteobacteria bacterium]|nr:helix-turn-helix domain-containing protein [Betaproteobacteria bacterium]
MRLTGGLTLTELATQCGLDRTTTHRMLDCLTREGLVSRQDGTRKYTLGPVVFESWPRFRTTVRSAHRLWARSCNGSANAPERHRLSQRPQRQRRGVR